MLIITSCNVTSSLQSNENLLVKNKIVFNSKIKGKSQIKEDLQLLTFQKPNNKLFYIFPLKLAIYNIANDDGRETKFKWWLKNKLGEPPVVFKEPLIFGASSSMKNYVFNLGYLHATVIPTVKIKKQKAIVTYTIEASSRYKVNDVVLPKKIDDITKIIASNQKASLIDKNDFLDVNILDDERQRLTNVLRDEGYYFFNKEYLRYDIDSLGKNGKVDLILKVNPPKVENGQQKFKINEVTIYTDYFIEKRNNIDVKLDSFDYEGYHFVTETHNIKPKALLFGVYLQKGDYYSLAKHKKTVQKIVSFGSFKFVNIEYRLNGKNDLDAFIYLTPSKKQSFSGDLEISHSFEGLSGTAVSLTYKNKNLSRSSDLLLFKVSAGVELNLFDKSQTLLNTADFNIELNYYVNKFIVPFPLKKVSKNSNVKTKFSLAYNYEDRIQQFTKHTTSFSAGYEWNETQTKKHFYNPFVISLLQIPKKDPSFIAQLDSLPSLAPSFEENIIFGSNYTFLMTNKKGDGDRSFFKFQGNIDLAGNIIHSIMLLAKNKSSDTLPYKIFGIEYAQFARFEANIVQTNKVSAHSELVTHFNAGIIIPYGNSSVAPYFQQFYSGGPNSLRGFRLRAIGPGSYSTEESFSGNNFYFDQSGDIKIEANVEYRFDIYKWFKWAFFADAGNVWLLKKDVDRPGGEFTSKFYEDIALSFGAGLRLDFTYFVIRTDLAMPIIDPRYDDNWRLNKIDFTDSNWRSRNLIFSLAIGYPF
ncbi:MAG: outer membrane protein insertion porin family [Planctomycetota bacterium]|jgi:outer membrane protein insertion porin family